MICNHCLQKPKVPNNMLINKLKGVYESLINKAHGIILLCDLNIDMLKEINELKMNYVIYMTLITSFLNPHSLKGQKEH